MSAQIAKACESLEDKTGAERLLEALAADLAFLAGDVERLGENLSEAYTKGKTVDYAFALQQFDLIAQGVYAISHMIGGLSPCLARSDTDAALQQLIDKIPFHAARLRLRAALDGTQIDEPTPTEDIDELF